MRQLKPEAMHVDKTAANGLQYVTVIGERITAGFTHKGDVAFVMRICSSRYTLTLLTHSVIFVYILYSILWQSKADII
jgi:hypothetical protein